MAHFFTISILWSLLLLSSPFVLAQNILSVGVSNYSKELKYIIEQEGFTTHPTAFDKINANSLSNIQIVTLFDLRQTWNGEQYLTQEQAILLREFVEKGGLLYLTCRKSYEIVLNELGITVTGNDGGKTGRDWPLIMEQTTVFEEHPLTEGLTTIVTDVSAQFEPNKQWSVLGRNTQQIPMLAIRELGLGKVILNCGERIFIDIGESTNRFESDINQGSNKQFHINLFRFLANPPRNASSQHTLDQQQTENFNIFPNPAKHSLTINGKNIQQIEVLNSNGQVLIQHIPNNREQIQLDVSALAQGLYFVKIKTSLGITTKEIVIE